jgi:uncharacterized protein YbjQ (UPF0145 family)
MHRPQCGRTLHRAVTNLMEHAVRFGAEAVTRLRVSADQLTIDVETTAPAFRRR